MSIALRFDSAAALDLIQEVLDEIGVSHARGGLLSRDGWAWRAKAFLDGADRPHWEVRISIREADGSITRILVAYNGDARDFRVGDCDHPAFRVARTTMVTYTRPPAYRYGR
jgi:hypothetical protein